MKTTAAQRHSRAWLAGYYEPTGFNYKANPYEYPKRNAAKSLAASWSNGNIAAFAAKQAAQTLARHTALAGKAAQ